MDQSTIHQAMNEQELIQAYKNEKDAKTKERLFLARQVFFDNQTASHVARNLGHVRSWPYKWPGRFEEHGMDGPHDRQRTGRPPKMPKDRPVAMERQIAGNPAGWSAKQVMSLIYEKSGARCHEVHVIGCFAIGDAHQGLHRKGLQTLRLHGKNSGLKKISGKNSLKNSKRIRHTVTG